MLNIAELPTFTRPVVARVPDGEAFREERFRATFRVVPVDQVAGFDFASEKGTRDFLAAAIVHLDDLSDGKNPVAYSEAARDQVLRLPYARMALVKTYLATVAEAQAGN